MLNCQLHPNCMGACTCIYVHTYIYALFIWSVGECYAQDVHLTHATAVIPDKMFSFFPFLPATVLLCYRKHVLRKDAGFEEACFSYPNYAV